MRHGKAFNYLSEFVFLLHKVEGEGIFLSSTGVEMETHEA